MTPEEIEVLMHCHVSPKVHPRISEPAVQQAIRMLEAGGIIRKDSDLQFIKGIYHTTTIGKDFIRILCEIPFPEDSWV